MARFVVMPLEGFLRDPVGGHLIPENFHLYRTLSSMYEVILVTTESNRQWTKDWLAMEGIFKYAQIVFPDYRVLITDNEAVGLARHLQLQGYNIDFWICYDPVFARELLEIGQSVMLSVRPSYAMPEWLPGHVKGTLAWEDIVKKTLLDKVAKLMDNRTELEEP